VNRRRHSRGNTTLEAALVLGPLFMLLFAIIDFSVAILVKNTLQASVREGVRYAVTGQTIAGAGGQDNSIKKVVQQNSLGFLTASNASLIGITYYDPKTLATVSGTNSNAAGNVVQISVNNFSWAWMVPYARSATALQMTAISADMVEPSPSGVPPTR
jgi:Flp pilus assembly protein TadG